MILLDLARLPQRRSPSKRKAYTYVRSVFQPQSSNYIYRAEQNTLEAKDDRA